ncbi:MAG: ABC-2 transporter permease [Ruminococcus sp.]|nr:ABC-2 transporter permease [Ruminococcus sp.]MBR1753165.1 ABC-2 transporter permease [Ruminococcus sp.]
MTPFKSLLYSEIAAAKKSIIVSCFMIVFFTVTMWLPIVFGDESVDAGSVILNLSASTTILMCSFSVIGLDEVSKAGIKCGWLFYSFTLPITPGVRAAVRIARRAAFTAAYMLFGYINIFAMCKAAGEPFIPEYIVMGLMMIDMTLLFSIMTDFFIESSRNDDELKANNARSGYASFAMTILFLFVLYTVFDLDVNELIAPENSAASMDMMRNFKVTHLYWLVPLLFVLICVHYFVLKNRLEKAFVTMPFMKKGKAEKTGSKADLTSKGFYAKGYLYKELVQNRTVYIMNIFLPIVSVIFFTLLVVIGETVFNGSTHTINKIINSLIGANRVWLYLIAFFISSSVVTGILQGDDKKIWAYFVTSSPQGVKGYLFNKFSVYLAATISFLLSIFATDGILYVIRYLAFDNKNEMNLRLYVTVFFAYLLITAIDIPLIIRFGTKKGSIIKTTAMLLIATIAIVIFSVVISEGARYRLIQDLQKLLYGGELKGLLNKIKMILPFAACASYAASYFLSCKLYLKGVAAGDK